MHEPLFAENGVHAMIDGQFGSTGKGALGAWLAQQAVVEGAIFDVVISNAGPNSGHTFYHNDEKHVLKMLPTFAVATYLIKGRAPLVLLTAGAIIDPDVLLREANKYPGVHIFVDPNAAVILPEDVAAEHSGTVAAVAGTRTGTGAALARKVLRDPTATFGNWCDRYWPGASRPNNIQLTGHNASSHLDWRKGRIFMEVSQGFSLGINSEFFPKVTSRECTVMQGIADARLPPQSVTKTYMVIRTYPIRVGNHEGFSSGGYYPDQVEVTWEDVGQTPELTTVTQRVRRVFTFSRRQLTDAVRANNPDFIFVNFLNYLNSAPKQSAFIDDVVRLTGKQIIGGWGPKSGDIRRVP